MSNIEIINFKMYFYFNYIQHIIDTVNIKVPSYSLYHDTISIIISQQFSFVKSREIRNRMMSLLDGESKFTYNFINFVLSENNLYKSLGITDRKYQILRSIPDIPDVKYSMLELENYISYISNIKGIGIWTCNALRVINRIPGSYISNDLYINKNLESMLGVKILKREIEYILNTFFPNHTLQFTILFWRIKKESIEKMIRLEPLTEDDFY